MSIYPNTHEPLIGPTYNSLLQEMEEKFPPQTIHPKEEINSIMYKAGQASVVEYVKQLLD